ncbi:DNA methylase [Porphyromonas gingivalis]|uniref:DNA methylase n=1 Tax=Porphyromonas gingivalis TaxID=837 RepID=UPI000C1982B0|nr:DNA methylase [Porphyromonas gingivalis]ATS10652.1 DNA methylase [Porphyromonas gingivalis]
MQAAPQGGIYNYFHSLLPPFSLAPFMPKTPLYSISLFFKGLKSINRVFPVCLYLYLIIT